jgi:membrane associated rhomboid family serine protease
MRFRPPEQLAGFRPVSIALIFFYSANIFVFVLVSLLPGSIDWLRLSGDRPWGIITSAFTQVDFWHLMNNLEGFLTATFLFAIVNWTNPVKLRERWSSAFLWIPIFAGIGANLLEYPLALANPGDSSWGASGIVYGALGAVLSAGLLKMPANIMATIKYRRKARKVRRWRGFRLNKGWLRTLPITTSLAVVFALLVLIIFDPENFLSVGPQTDVFSHAVGFLLGFIGFAASQRFRTRHP